MKQAIAGVALPQLGEATAMTIWPTIAATGAGRLVGRLAAIEVGAGKFFTLGKLLAVATIPISLAVFAWQLLPFICRRYTLTNRRIIIQKGLGAVEECSIGLDEFDTIAVEILPGQQWLHAGELIFRRDGSEVFRLPGVSRPQVFRQVCLKVQNALLSVRQVVEQQVATHEQPASS